MIYNQKEALRLMCAREDDREAANLCDLVYLKLRNDVQARHLIKRMNCDIWPDGVQVGEIFFKSASLAEYLKGCEEVLLFAATLGPKVDGALKRIMLNSLAESNAAQAVAASLIETYSNQVLDDYVTDGLVQLPRFSPGYGDWDLVEQKKFFQIMDCTKIGLTLTDSCMMVPMKSITAVVGLSKEKSSVHSSCEICGLENCLYRK